MWYLCVFYHRLLDYRKPEVESLAELFGVFNSRESESGRENGNPEKKCLQWRLPQYHHPDSPFHFVDLPSDDIARKIANRSESYPSFVFSLLDDLWWIIILLVIIKWCGDYVSFFWLVRGALEIRRTSKRNELGALGGLIGLSFGNAWFVMN